MPWWWHNVPAHGRNWSDTSAHLYPITDTIYRRLSTAVTSKFNFALELPSYQYDLIAQHAGIVTLRHAWHISTRIQYTSVWWLLKSWFHMMTSSNGIICRITGHLCGEFTGPRWIPRTKASDAELWCFLWSAPEPTLEQTMKTLVIWKAIALIMTSL